MIELHVHVVLVFVGLLLTDLYWSVIILLKPMLTTY